jgi:acetyltransferase-like isoleucine patch superfamily enzyme
MKKLVKNLIDLLCIIAVLPLIILNKVFDQLSSKDSFFELCTQLLSLIPGKPGSYLRKNFFRFSMAYCDSNCLISFAALFSHRDTEIHKNVYIGPQCNIGKSRIEKNCLLGSGVHILSGKGQHNINDLETPIQQQGGTFTKITIGQDTWIGNNAVIMANIGEKCVIGAGSVVTKDIPPYSVVGGNPATVIRSRKP